MEEDSNSAVRSTAFTAAESKLSAVKLGYWEDPFLEFLIPVSKAIRGAPIMNRGYFARVNAFDSAIANFSAGFENGLKGIQVVNLGAGMDTTFFRLKKANKNPKLFVDVDFKETCINKAHLISTLPIFVSLMGQPVRQQSDQIFYKTDEYVLAASNICDLNSLQTVLTEAGVSFSLPTLFMFECVLVYIYPGPGNDLMKWIIKNFSDSAIIGYDPIGPDDAFGKKMVDNFIIKGSPLVSISTYKTTDSYRQRLLDNGFLKSESETLVEYFNRRITRQEKARVNRLEMFDEYEEWNLMLSHYCIYYGCTKENIHILNEEIK